MNKKTKNLLLLSLLAGFVIFLSACSRSTAPITMESEGIWEGVILYGFSNAIIWLSELFGGSYGIGIILFTIIVRVILIPLTMYQTKSMRKMNEIQPELNELREKYPSKDQDSVEKMNEEQARLFEERGINPYASCLPLIMQMPILIALYQSISRTPIISESSFLWVNLGEPDPYFILPILAAIFTFANSKLTQMASPVDQGAGFMSYMMPVMIFFISFRLASALSLYFVVSNAFSVVQTLLFNNPFEINREREEKAKAEREAERNRKSAIRRARKTGRSVKK